MNYKLNELLNVEMFQKLLDSLNVAFGVTSAIIDNESNIITASGWQEACTKFHRFNVNSENECKKSDKFITDHIFDANPSVVYKCPHGLIDTATPIIIENVHLANFLIGQIFVEEPNMVFYNSNAAKYSYDIQTYLEAIRRIPVISLDQLNKQLNFVSYLTEILINLGVEKIKQYELIDSLNQKNINLNQTLSRAFYSLSKVSEIRDRYTSGHQKRVQQLAVKIAEKMKLESEVIENISLGAMVHDIGRIYIPSDILNKPEILTDLEYELIKTHPKYGFDIVNEMELPWQIPTMIYQHHERLDGSGYPEGIKGETIILESRILAVAEVVEAMCSHRPYRAALGLESAINEILTNKHTKYDPTIVDICIEIINDGFSFHDF